MYKVYSSIPLKVFSASGLKPQALQKNGEEWNDSQTHPIYECVTALRVVLSRLERPENWGVVGGMATHREERSKAANAPHNLHNVVNFLLKVTKVEASSFFILLFLQHARLEEALPGVTADDITRFAFVNVNL